MHRNEPMKMHWNVLIYSEREHAEMLYEASASTRCTIGLKLSSVGAL